MSVTASLTELARSEIAAISGGFGDPAARASGFPSSTFISAQKHAINLLAIGLSSSFVGATAKCFSEWLGYYLPMGNSKTWPGFLWNGARKFIIYFTCDILANASWFAGAYFYLGGIIAAKKTHEN